MPDPFDTAAGETHSTGDGCEPNRRDLAELVAAAVIANRDEINASRIAQGEAGRIEIHVNLRVRSVRLAVIVEGLASTYTAQ